MKTKRRTPLTWRERKIIREHRAVVAKLTNDLAVERTESQRSRAEAGWLQRERRDHDGLCRMLDGVRKAAWSTMADARDVLPMGFKKAMNEALSNGIYRPRHWAKARRKATA
jgi:hypothetical protein